MSSNMEYPVKRVGRKRQHRRTFNVICIISLIIFISTFVVWMRALDEHLRTIRWYNYYNESMARTRDNRMFGVRERSNSANCITYFSDESMARSRNALLLALRTLEEHGARVFVCRGTLWGVLRRNDILPHDVTNDLCVLDSEMKKSSVGSENTLAVLRDVGFEVSGFDSWTGRYRMTLDYNSLYNVTVDLNVFDDCTLFYRWIKFKWTYSGRWACPKSWAFYVFHMSTDAQLGFPMTLVQPPYQRLALDLSKVPVPHGNIELQKYFYRNDWWMEISPPYCEI